MARIGENAFRQYRDGQDRLTAPEYMAERELIRLAVNDLDDKIQRTEGIREEFTNTVNEVGVVRGEVVQTKQEVEARIDEFSQTIDQTTQELQNKASKEEMQEVSIQMNSVIKQAVPVSLLGMIPNDESKALDNYTVLLNEVKKGTKLLIDGTYFVKSPHSSANVDNEIVNTIFITGNDADKSKLISNGGWFFNAKGDVKINNIAIDCRTNALTYLIVLVAPYHVSVDVKRNYVTGNVRMVNSNIPQSFDFENSPFCGIKEISIENNVFYDVYNSSGSRNIFGVTDTPVLHAYIRDNIVTNFSYVFYNNGITNGHPNTAFIYKNSKKTIIEGNKVVCTDDYDVKAKNANFMGTYYCFTLLETDTCECRRNTFEGFHIIDSPGTVLYDNYFSVSNLTYEENTWKNLVNFTPGIQYVDIMKSKMGLPGEKLVRVYRKNHYIVEPEYADKFGQDRYLLRKEIDTYQDFMDSVTIEDNYFDLYTLGFNRYKQTKDYIFSKNTIRMETLETSNNTQAFVGIQEYKDSSGNTVPRQLLFTHNNIIVKDSPTGTAAGSKEISLIRNYTGNGDKVTLVFENNYIKLYELKYVLSDERTDAQTTNSPNLANIKFNGNTVVTERQTNTFFFTKNFKNLYSFKNNEFETAVKNTGQSAYVFYEQFEVAPTTRYTLPLCMDLELDLRYRADQWLKVLPLKGLFDMDYRVSLNVKILSDTTFEEFDVNFTIRNNGTTNLIEGMGMNVKQGEKVYTQQSYTLDGTGNNNNNFYLQQENAKGTNTINVNVSNTATVKEVVLHSKAPRSKFNGDKVKIKMSINKA